jgi:hypothetical protein
VQQLSLPLSPAPQWVTPAAPVPQFGLGTVEAEPGEAPAPLSPSPVLAEPPPVEPVSAASLAIDRASAPPLPIGAVPAGPLSAGPALVKPGLDEPVDEPPACAAGEVASIPPSVTLASVGLEQLAKLTTATISVVMAESIPLVSFIALPPKQVGPIVASPCSGGVVFARPAAQAMG